ncbi:MAG: hypothetical protein WC979_05040 [Candidatus Pacearchaeota archaeon]|jgi:hypothetical protein
MKKHLIVVLLQGLFLFLIAGLIYYFYPTTNASVDGNWVNFNSINAKVIMISENPDFSNSRYLDLTQRKNISLNLNPGTYYWKSDNGIIEGLQNELVVVSEVGMKIDKTSNQSDLVNLGNVKINVTKTKEGAIVGQVILSPEQYEQIEDSGNYVGRQDGK